MVVGQKLPKGVFPKIGVFPPKWMVKIMENPIYPWMIWGQNTLFSETSKDLPNSVKVFGMDLANARSSWMLSTCLSLRFGLLCQNWLPEIMTQTCKKYGFADIKKNSAIVWVRNYSKCFVQNLERKKLPASSSLGVVCLNSKLGLEDGFPFQFRLPGRYYGLHPRKTNATMEKQQGMKIYLQLKDWC